MNGMFGEGGDSGEGGYMTCKQVDEILKWLASLYFRILVSMSERETNA